MSRISIRPANRADALSSTKNPINSVKNKPLRMIAYEPKKNFRRHLLAGTALALAVGFALPAHAAPNGGTVANGSASITLTGDTGTQTTTVRQSSARAIINWSGFDLAKGDIVNYIVPDHSSATLNRISGARSQIDGTIQSNGSLYFVNQNGFVFGADSHVTAQNLIVTTQAIDAAQFMQAQSPTNSGNYQNFTGTSLAAASIELNGTVTVADRGVVAFFAPQVTASKSSVIAANLGSVTLAGSENITVIDFKGDGLINFQLGDSASQILAKHEGVIRANGGQVILTAHGAKNLLNAVLEENGTVDASSAQGKGGDVTLVAANGTVTIGKNAVIDTSSAKDPAGTLSVSDSFNSAYIGPITFAYWALVQQQNENQAVADLKASQTITIESGAVLRANGHAARNIGVTHNSTVNSTVVNEGSIYVNASNKLNNSGSLTSHSGSIALTAGGDVQNDGTLTVNNAVGKAGDILVTGATITLADGSVLDASSASGSAGNIKLGTQTGDLWIAKGAKILAKSVNGYGIVTLQSKSNLQFDGTIDAAAAVVNVDVGQDFVANGVIDLSSTTSIGGDFHANAANILVTENGVINASSKVSNAGAIILGHASTTANVTIDLGGKLYANSLAGLKGGAIKLNANQTVQNNGTIQAQGGTISLLAQGPDNVLSAALINNGVIDASAVIGDGGEVTLSTTSGIVTLGSQSVIDVSSLNGKSGGKVIINDDYTGSLANVHESATDVAYKKAKANLDQKTNDFINTTHDRERARSAVEAARKDYDAAEVTLANAKLELESVRKEQTPSEDSIKNATQKVADATQNFATATRALRDANVKFESFAAKIDAAKLEVSEASGEYIVAQYKLAHDPISNLAVTARVKGQTVTFAEGSQIIANGSSGGSIQVRAFKNLLNNGTIQSSGGGINLTATQNLVNNGTIDGSVLSGQGGVVILQVSSWAPPRPPKSADYPTNNSVHGTLALGGHSVIDVSSKNGNGGKLSIATNDEGQVLLIDAGSLIKANSATMGNAGTIQITAPGDVSIDGNLQALVSDHNGEGGHITLTTTHALVTNKVHFDTSSSAGQFGTLTISAPDLVLNGVPGDEQIVLFKPVASNIIEVGNLDNWLQLNNVVLNSIAPKSETFAQLASGGKIMLHSDNNLTLNAGIGGIRIGGSLENVGSGKLLLTVDRDIGDANYLSKNKYDASKFGNILIENRVSVQDLTAIVAKGNGQIFVSKNGVITARDQASFSTITGDITFDAAVTTHELALTTKGGAISINDDITLDGNGALAVTVEGAGNISFAKNKTVLGGRVVTLYTQTGIITLGKDLIVSDGVQLAIKDILANGVTQANLKQLAGSDPKLRAELDLIARAANSSNADQNAAFDLLAKIEPEVAVRLKFFKLASGSGTAEQKANAVTVLGVYDPEFATDYAAAQTLATQKLRDEQSDLVIHNAMQRLVVRANADRYLAAIERDKSLTAVTSAAVKLALGAESTPLLLASDADYQTKFATIYGKGIDAHDTLALSKSDILSYDTKTQDDAFKKLAQLDEAAANRLKIAIRNAQALPTGTVQLNAAQQLAYQIAVDSYLQGSAEKAHENVFAQAKIDVTKASRSELHFTAKKIITSSGDIAVNDTPHNGANGRLTTRELPSNYTYFDLDAGGGSFTYNQTGNEGAAITINHKYAASTDPSVVKANLSDAQVITITNNGPLILVGVDTLIGTLKASSSSDLTLNSPITANGSVDLSAGGNVTIGASIKAKGDVSLSTPRDLQINSSLEAGGNFTLSANHLNFGNDPGAKGSIKAGTGNTITLHQLATDRDLIVDQNFLATINYDPSISLNLLSRRDLKITAALNGTNGTNIHLFSVGTLSTTSPITTGALEIEGKYVSIGNNITVGAGGISVLAGGEAKPRNDLGLVISGPTGKPGGDYYVKATDGGDINLKTLKGVQIWVQSTLSARNITVSTTEGTLVFEKPVLADAFDGAGGSFSAKLNGNGGLLFKDTVTVNSLSIENKANGSIDFYRDLTLNSYAPKGSTDATSGGTVSITTENGSITFSKAAHIVSNDPSHLAYKINFVTKRGIVMNTDLGVRAGGVMNLEAWLINYTKITADNANLVIKQNGYKSRIWNKKLVKVAPYDITLDDRISFKNANTIYFQTLGTIYVKHDLSAPNVVLLANHVDIPDGVTIRATVGGILAFAQFGSYTVDNTLLAKFKDYQNANLKLISGGTLTVANDIKMNEGYNLSLAMFDVNLKANVSVSRATMSVSYINGDIYSIAKFEQSNADHILLGKGSKFEIVGASNLTVNGVVKNQYIADYKLSNSGVMTINANLLASQHLGFSAAKGLIYINNAVGISSPYGEPVVITTQDNGKFLKFGTGGKILPLPAEDVAEGQK